MHLVSLKVVFTSSMSRSSHFFSLTVVDRLFSTIQYRHNSSKQEEDDEGGRKRSEVGTKNLCDD